MSFLSVRTSESTSNFFKIDRARASDNALGQAEIRSKPGAVRPSRKCAEKSVHRFVCKARGFPFWSVEIPFPCRRFFSTFLPLFRPLRSWLQNRNHGSKTVRIGRVRDSRRALRLHRSALQRAAVQMRIVSTRRALGPQPPSLNGLCSVVSAPIAAVKYSLESA